MRFTYIIILVILPFLVNGQKFEADTTLLLMGTRFQLKAVSDNKDEATRSVQKGIDEIQRIEKLISSHLPGSQTYYINKQSGKSPVVVDDELFSLIKRCVKISRITDGAFDITFSPLYELWKFDGSMTSLPDSVDIKAQLELVDYRMIDVDSTSMEVYLPLKGMSVGFGAIGKGYAANMAKRVMIDAGAIGGFVNASGDILFWGKNKHDQPWKVAIASPLKNNEMIGDILVSDLAVVTSGNYEKNFEVDGKLYSHIIDPKTGYPVEEAVSVTIVGPDAEIGDALATAVSVLGVKDGIKLINKIKYFEGLIIDEKLMMHKSDHFEIHK
ncbi:MAG: FAD:protein FMN transferase [Prolixibacteraceae bacterium]|nr:FAD:protein FMN transferase [Prolixibacteraceae bacterium]